MEELYNDDKFSETLALCAEHVKDERSGFLLYRLGVLYNYGEGVQKNEETGLEYFQKALEKLKDAPKDNLLAMHSLG